MTAEDGIREHRSTSSLLRLIRKALVAHGFHPKRAARRSSAAPKPDARSGQASCQWGPGPPTGTPLAMPLRARGGFELPGGQAEDFYGSLRSPGPRSAYVGGRAPCFSHKPSHTHGDSFS